MKPYERVPFLEAHVAAVELFKRIALVILGSMLLFASAVGLLGGTLIWHACRTWPQAQGKIVRFTLQPDPEERRLMVLDLEYEFSAHGKSETGTQLSPYVHDNRMHVWLARWKERQYRAGQPITVMYDPNDTGRNFVERPGLVECLARVAGTAAFGGWMVYLFFRFRRRRMPRDVISAKEQRTSVARDEIAHLTTPIVLRGISSHSPLGSVLSGWPRCRVALVVDRFHFAVVQGPYTKLGIASSFLTMFLLIWLQSVWMLLLLHVIFDTKEIVFRRMAWNTLGAGRFNELSGADPINNVVVYGLEPRRNRLWYRIERRGRDEFIEIADEDRRVAEHFVIGFDAYSQMSNERPTG